MLDDYRDWLLSELKLLGNASHHAYSFGQANMATRAIQQLDALFAGKAVVVLDPADARQAAAAMAPYAELAAVQAELIRAAEAASTPPEPVIPATSAD